MAKFCTRCGKNLEDGTVCECSNDIETNKKTFNFNELSNLLKNTFLITKEMLKKPIDTTTMLIKESNITLSITIIILTSIIFGLNVLAFIKNSISLFYSSFIYKTSSLNSFDFFNSNELTNTISSSIPWLEIFIKLVFSLIALLILFSTIMQFINNKIYGSDSSLKKIISLIAASSISFAVLSFISMIFTFINIEIASICLLIGSIGMLINIYSGIKNITTIDENKYSYLLILSIITEIIVSYLFLTIIK